MKTPQSILEGLEPLMAKLMMSLSVKKSRPISGGRDSHSQHQGPRLCLTSPEEERAIFRDTTDPPTNMLVEELKNRELNEPLVFPQTDKAEPGGATKDDKAPIKSEKWDKMLYLELSEYVRAGPWAQAACTIHPLLACHWRWLQLRKWILYVRKRRANLKSVSEANREAARDCFLRLQATTFWEWKSGSGPMFWNYPGDQQVTIRDGIMLWI
jgi:hypothetical protein